MRRVGNPKLDSVYQKHARALMQNLQNPRNSDSCETGDGTLAGLDYRRIGSAIMHGIFTGEDRKTVQISNESALIGLGKEMETNSRKGDFGLILASMSI